MHLEQEIEVLLKKEKVITEETTFSWEEHSPLIAEHCPNLIDPQKFDWQNASYSVVAAGKQYITLDKLNWNCDFTKIELTKRYPELTQDPRFQWKTIERILARYNPKHLDPTKIINWEAMTAEIAIHHPALPLLRTHGVWNERVLDIIRNTMIARPHLIHYVWYDINLEDLLDSKKRKRILKKIEKQITLDKI